MERGLFPKAFGLSVVDDVPVIVKLAQLLPQNAKN